MEATATEDVEGSTESPEETVEVVRKGTLEVIVVLATAIESVEKVVVEIGETAGVVSVKVLEAIVVLA